MAVQLPQPDQFDNGTRDLFLSYNSRDIEAVRAIAEQLHTAKLTTFLDKKNLKPGLPWMPDLEHSISHSRALAVFIGKHGFGPYQETEIQLAIIRQVDERKNDRAFPVIPVLLPGAEPESISGFLRLNHFLDLRNDASAADQLQSLISTIRGGEPSSLTQTEIDLCPYRALRAFREEDAPLFFGREEFAEQLLAKTQQHSLIAVVGPSGSGKSSVVQAGLMPLLRREHSPRPTWDAVVFTPGRSPFHNLADKLVATWSGELSQTKRLRESEGLGSDLANGKVRLEAAIRLVLEASKGADRLLVVVDQFEELFTLTEEKDRKPFVEALLSASALAPVTIALTLRADFYGQAIGLHRDLSDRIQQGLVNLGPLTREEMRRAIENPARSVGLEFESGLVERILDNVEGQPGNLPLLEFALTELWGKRQGRLLTHHQYEDIGEVEGAIGQRAEQLFGSFEPNEQRIALRALTRLVRVSAGGEEGADTRQRVRLSDLDGTAQVVVQKFVRARLLVASRNEATHEETVEVAHEALIRRWKRLTDLLNKDREFLLWRQRLGFMSREWQRTNKDKGALLDGALLKEAKDWSKERRAELNEQEKEFIAASESASQRPRYWIATAAALVIMAALAFAGWKYWDNRPETQINKIILQTPGYVKAVAASSIGQKEYFSTAARWLQTLALTGRSSEALTAARKIETAYFSSQALAELVEALVKASKTEEARQAATEALAVARTIKDAGSRSQALVNIAEALTKAGKLEEAQKAATEALDAAKLADFKSEAIEGAIKALAISGKTTEALDAARTMDAYDRWEALKSVFELLDKAGKAEALNAARTIETAYSRSMAMADAGEALAKAGKTEEAGQVATEALDAARKIGEGADYRPRALVQVVQALAIAGNFTKALDVARTIETVKHRSEALGTVVIFLAEAGKTTEAFDAMHKIEDTATRLKALAGVTEALAKAGKTSEAHNTARKIEDANTRSWALVKVVEALAKVGKNEEAKQAATEALDAAREMGNSSFGSFILSEVIKALAKAGRTTEALNAAHTVRSAQFRSRALVSVAEVLAMNRETESQARTALEAAQQAAEQITDEGYKSAALADVAKGLAKLHLYRQARELVDNNNTSAADKLTAYTAILRECHLERHPEDKKLLEKEEQE